ncbi:MAG: IS1182 family transposase [Desulfobacteraceae bacterium]|nr:MAG: IS1182 family transposase [Desulfobacteraceae bacterium]
MARYRHYDMKQSMMIAVSLEEQLKPGTLEYAIHYLIEDRIETSYFDERFCNDETGRCAYNPKVLLKVVLYGYSRGMMSSRSIERACVKDVTFIALSCGQTPDHSTIAAFVSSMGDEIIRLYIQVLLVCEQEGLLGGTHFSLDGLKLSSNASKEWSGKFEDLQKKKENLERKVREAIREHRKADKDKREKNDTDRDRREKRIKRLKRQAERIEKFLSENEAKIGAQGKEIQSNVTDNESAKMATSHGVIQGYNANALVDEKHQVIVHAEAFGTGDDSGLAGDMLVGAEENLHAIGWDAQALKGREISADSGYYSVGNLEVCRDLEVDAYIPDPKFRQRDQRFADAERHRRPVDKHKEKDGRKKYFTPSDFRLDDATGKLICPAGESLYVCNRNFEVKGRRAIAYHGTKRGCGNCALRAKCLRNPNTVSRQVHIFYGDRPGSLTDAMKNKIDTPEGRATYSKRLGIVEPVFGNIRVNKGLNRFTVRGLVKVNIQWMLYCLVHNIEKILHFGKTYAMAA